MAVIDWKSICVKDRSAGLKLTAYRCRIRASCIGIWRPNSYGCSAPAERSIEPAMNATATTTDAAISNQKRLLKLARKRLQRFATLVPKVLLSDDPDTVHDLRVWSRRLQQALRVIQPSVD